MDSADGPSLPESIADAAGQSPSLFSRMARFAGINQTIAHAMLGRFWQLLTGPVTQLLIALYFSPSTRDYYTAFGSLLGLQVCVELGLHAVLINLTSREWAGLGLIQGKITGDPQCLKRLARLLRLMLCWYAFIASAFVIGLLLTGFAFFGTTQFDWIAPWTVLVLLHGILLLLLPATSILEGCHQVGTLYKVRFWQGVVGSVVVWFVIWAGLGLWSLVAAAIVRVAGDLYLVRIRYRTFFADLLSVDHTVQAPLIDWSSEILPLQWRTGVQGITLWGANQLPVLVVFKTALSDGEAGRIGMTWTVLTAFQSACMAFVEARRPLLGSLIAQGRVAESDRLFFQSLRCSMLAITGMLLAFLALIWGVTDRPEWIARRISAHFLGLEATAWYCLAFLAYQFVMCIGIHVRAHRIEPFLVASVTSFLLIALLECWLGLQFRALGVSVGYAVGVVAILLPSYTLVWKNFLRERNQQKSLKPA